jgi:hypothetical protein
MRLPESPLVKELTHLSPSLYEAARLCNARAAWAAFGARDRVPQSPQALLGTCLHAVVEEAHHGRFASTDNEGRRGNAQAAFDRKAKELHQAAHPLIRIKFPIPERIPYYYLFRERAAVLALGSAGRTRDEPPPMGARRGAAAPPGPLVEITLRSQDGLLFGRPDYLDPAAGEVVDYKTGSGPDDDPDGLRDGEARQLRLYVHLANERGINLRRGVVVRADGRRIPLEITEADATAEGQLARTALVAFNAKAPRGFQALATPSPDACRYCPCIPFCEAFWEAGTPTWRDASGTHVEGTVSAISKAVVQDTALMTLELAVTRGSLASPVAVVQQVPEAWVCADGAPPSNVGDVIRVVNGRLADDDGQTALIRADRVTTALWSVEAAAHEFRSSDSTGHD